MVAERLNYEKWKVFSLVFAVALVISLGFNVYQSFDTSNNASYGNSIQNDEANKQMNFTFTWGPKTQDIVNRTFKIEVSAWFENHTSPWDNTTYQMFYIILRVYDDDYNSNDYLGLVFDMNHNGVIDLGAEDDPLLTYADNSTVYTWAASLMKEGFFAVAEVPRIPALNKCRYDPEKGYVFGSFGGATSDFASKFGDLPAYIPIHMCFYDANLYPGVHVVSVQFRIYIYS